ncbi:MAG: SCO6745 family protein [Jatrophihabitans sp.]
MSHPEPVARRMYHLVEPVGLVPYLADEPNDALMALGLRNYWDTYFAGRAAPFGRDAPAEVIHSVFYNFAEDEVARHIPKVWELTTPEAALAAREQGCVAGLRGFIGDLADDPSVARAADLLTKAATSAPTGGRPLYAALRALPVPDEPVARLWHAATLVREHRGDGHVVALMVEDINGTQAHVLQARALGVTDQQYGRVGHLPGERLNVVIGELQARGLLDADGQITDAGRAARARIEALTDRLAEPPYNALTPAELEQLVADLAPISAPIRALLPF